ncbi:MAG TPA: glycosyltransferase family 39 protein, partial [bacterium]
MNLADDSTRRKLFLCILLLAVLLRVPDLGHKSIWGDEATSIYVSLGVTTANDHPPAYYFLSSLPVRIFGLSEFPLRLASAIFGLLMVWGVFRLGEICSRLWPWIPRSYGLVAALLVTVTPYYIQLAQENRPYSMIAAITAWSCYFFLLILLKMGILGPQEKNTSSSRGALAGYIVTLALGIYSHYFIWLVLASQGLFWLFLFLRRPQHRLKLLRLLMAPAVIFILFLPLLPDTIAKVTTRAPGIEASSGQLSLKYYATRPLASAFHFATGYYFTGEENLSALRSSPLRAILLVIFAIIPALIFLAGLICLIWPTNALNHRQKWGELAFFLLTGLAVTLLGAMTIDTSIARQHSISGVYFFMIFALGFIALPAKLRRPAALLYGAIILASWFSYYSLNTHPFYRTDWRAAARYLKASYHAGDLVYVSSAE